MKNLLKQGLILSAILGFFFLPASAKIKFELSGFGKFNANLGFPGSLSRAASVEKYASSFHKESQAFFFEPALEQKNGLGFGARAAMEFAPKLAFEISFEYLLAAMQFRPEIMEAFKTKMETKGYGPFLKYKESGGEILRFYGSCVYNLSGGNVIPYLIAGAGLTKFNIKPFFEVERTDLFEEKADLHYSNATALSFHGGFGLKYYFSSNFGLRFETLLFYSPVRFYQAFSYTWLGYTFISESRSVTQKGSLIDASFSLGLVIRL